MEDQYLQARFLFVKHGIDLEAAYGLQVLVEQFNPLASLPCQTINQRVIDLHPIGFMKCLNRNGRRFVQLAQDTVYIDTPGRDEQVIAVGCEHYLESPTYLWYPASPNHIHGLHLRAILEHVLLLIPICI